MKHQPQSSLPRGQGLLEVIIGVGVIIAGTVGSVTLISSTIKASRQSNTRILAASLAREGIEVVRNIRDSNWLVMQANAVPGTTSWSGIFEPSSGNRHFVIPTFNQVETWAITSLFGNGGAALANLDAAYSVGCPFPGGSTWNCSVVFLNGNGYYQKSSGATGTNSLFTRIIQLHPICRLDADHDGLPDSPAALNQPLERIESGDTLTCLSNAGPTNEVFAGLQIISTVRWARAATTEQYDLEERLYSWKYIQ